MKKLTTTTIINCEKASPQEGKIFTTHLTNKWLIYRNTERIHRDIDISTTNH